MSSTTVPTDAGRLSARLLEERWMLPTSVAGVAGHSPNFEALVDALDRHIVQLAIAEGAETPVFPPVVPRDVLERATYIESFPHLAGIVFGFAGHEPDAVRLAERVRAGGPWADLLSMTDLALTPAACYPLYPMWRGELPSSGAFATVRSWVFRREPSDEITRLQAFRMREVVRAARSDVVETWRLGWLTRACDLLRALGLAVEVVGASDPFFGRGGRLLAESQRASLLKAEIVTPVTSAAEPTALCSANAHHDHFSTAFGIRTAGGPAHTACVGFGLERVVIALLQQHGFDVEGWPTDVRQMLWPS